MTFAIDFAVQICIDLFLGIEENQFNTILNSKSDLIKRYRCDFKTQKACETRIELINLEINYSKKKHSDVTDLTFKKHW